MVLPRLKLLEIVNSTGIQKAFLEVNSAVFCTVSSKLLAAHDFPLSWACRVCHWRQNYPKVASGAGNFDSHVSVGMLIGKQSRVDEHTRAYSEAVNQGETRHKEIAFNLSWHQLPPGDRRPIFSWDSFFCRALGVSTEPEACQKERKKNERQHTGQAKTF